MSLFCYAQEANDKSAAIRFPPRDALRGARVVTDESNRRVYARDLADIRNFIERALFRTTPLIVVQPRSTQEVAGVLRLANEENVPVFPRGVASSAFGGPVPTTNGIVLDLSPMQKIDPPSPPRQSSGGGSLGALDSENARDDWRPSPLPTGEGRRGEGDKITLGAIASEKQAIDAFFQSLHREDARITPIADKYWNARGGSFSNGGAFVFSVKGERGAEELNCFDTFGRRVIAPRGTRPFSENGVEIDENVLTWFDELLNQDFSPRDAFNEFLKTNVMQRVNFKTLTALCEHLVQFAARGEDFLVRAIEFLSLLNDMRYDCGDKKRSSVLTIVHAGYFDDPRHQLTEDQLNEAEFVTFADDDWRVIEPYLRENEKLFGIRVADLLEGNAPNQAFRKVVASKRGAIAGSERGE